MSGELEEEGVANSSLDAVDDLMSNPTFTGQFTHLVRGLPDLEVRPSPYLH